MTAPCLRAPELEAALDQRLSADARDAVLAHAETCARCRDALDARAALRAHLDALPRLRPDPLGARRLRAAIMAKTLVAPPEGTAHRVAPWHLAAAAVLTVGLAGAVAVRFTAPRNAGETSTQAPPALALGAAGAMRSAPGARYLVLSTGAFTHVRLLEGSAHFSVVHRRAGERFVVSTDDAEVEVRGTRFVVEVARRRLRSVRVDEGRVAVRRRGQPEQLLDRGATLRVDETPTETPTETSAETPAEPERVVRASAPSRPPTAESAPPRRSDDEGLALRRDRDFREGALAFLRREDRTAAESLGRFLARAEPSDARREDARYVRVLALSRLGEGAASRREAMAYLREFSRGLRRAEVVSVAVRMAVAEGACDEAARVALRLDDEAEARVRDEVTSALARCR
ncbi:MAG: FecR domain-containing protein [Myxococcales bacterium]|nr:FecR domain-containing protein [Myxococcales bacterium]